MSAPSSGVTGLPLRQEIAQSWRRAMACGLRPDTPLDRPRLSEVDTGSRLLRAAGPVLTELAADLEGTRFALMLADRDACIVDRRFSDGSLEAALDGIGAVLGNRFTEETSGTNSIATALELRQGIAIIGAEHFMEPMKCFSCYGQPILHPATRRIEAVLQITGPAEEANALWAPIVNRAATDISRRLLAGARADQQRMLAAFQQAVHRSDSMVVVIAEDIVMSDTGAQRTLEPADQLILRELAQEADEGERRRNLVLADGTEVRVRYRRLADAPTGVLFELVNEQQQDCAPIPRKRSRNVARDMTAVIDAHRSARARLLICGEPGSGRTTVATRLADSHFLARFDAAEHAEIGERQWLATIADAIRDHDGLVLLEDIHLLPPASAARVTRLLSSSSAWYALTSCPLPDLGSEHAALAATCTARLELPPLRYRRDELPELVRKMLFEITPGCRLRVASRVWEVLRGHEWPANLRELRAVLAHAIAHRRSDVLTVEDLPVAYRTSRPIRRLSLLEQAEHDTIVRALRDHGGNKVHAAEVLGISRTTLYKRIRLLGIEA